MKPFKINHIDHVALRVHDSNRSIDWYCTHLNFKELDTPEWDRYPVLIGIDHFFIALFSQEVDSENAEYSDLICIDHFALNVTEVDFERVKDYFMSIGLNFKERDHHYSKSIYLRDPDNHVVELTTITREIPYKKLDNK